MAYTASGTIATGASTSANTTVVANVAETVPVGTLVVVGVVCDKTGDSPPGLTVTDSNSHDWTVLTPISTQSDVGHVYMAWTVIDSQLDNTDTITATFSTAKSRKALVADAFTVEEFVGFDEFVSAAPGGSGGNYTIGPTGPVSSVPQIAVAAAVRTASVTVSAGAGWTAGGTAVTSDGSSDRGVALFHSDVTVAESTVSCGIVLSGSSSARCGIIATFAYEETGPTPLPVPSGFTFEAHPTLPQLNASWSEVPEADDGYAFRLEKATTSEPDPESDGDWEEVQVFTTPETSIVLTADDGVLPGTTYAGSVRALTTDDNE